jgi:integrase
MRQRFRFRPVRLPARAARQLPDHWTTLRVDSSSTDDSRLQGARFPHSLHRPFFGRFSPEAEQSRCGAKPPLRPKHVWSIRTKLQVEGRIRDLAMFNLAIDSKLRGCDVVALKVEDIAPNGYAVERATVRQKKTGQPVKFELSEQTRQAVDDYVRTLSKLPGEFLFPSRRKRNRPIATRQYARLVDKWVASIGLDATRFGTHSLRRTKASLIYRRTGNLRAVQLLLGHTKIESTVRYLGIEVDDALAIAEQVDV